MITLYDTLADVVEFADRHGLDAMELTMQIAVAKAGTMPQPVEPPPCGDGARKREPAAVVEPAPRQVALPEGKTDRVLEEVKRHWKRQRPGFVGSSREIYEHAGHVMPRHAKALTHWLRHNPDACALVIRRSLKDRSYVFVRTDGTI